jgi:hypothetical protein
MAIAGQTFTEIQPGTISITITSPNGGEIWKVGTTQTIRWTYGGSLGSKVRIELLKGGVVTRIIKSSVSIGKNESGSYNWKIPSNQTPGNNYQIRVTSTSNSSYTDTSNSNFSIASPSADNTVVGTWEIDGTMKVTLSTPGYGTETELAEFYDEFTFYPNGDFEMIDMDGTWVQNKNKFTVFLDPQSVEWSFEDYFADFGLDLYVEVAKITLTGTVQKDGTLKGKLTLKMDIYIYDVDLDGRVNVSGSFLGTRSTGSQVLSLEEHDFSPNPKSLGEIIVEKFQRVIKDFGHSRLKE